MSWRAKVRFLLLSSLLVIAGLPPTAVAATTGTTWSQSIPVRDELGQFVDYRRLTGTGDVRYYRLTVQRATPLYLQLDIARAAVGLFAPQVVLYQPDGMTIGPILPIDQPPKTLASVYPITAPRTAVDTLTQARYAIRLEARPTLPTAGTYYLAVYNASRFPGSYRLIIDRGGATVAVADIWGLPSRWWQDQTMAGFNLQTLITPALLALALWLVWKLLDHHQLHPHRKYPPRAKKRSTHRSQ